MYVHWIFFHVYIQMYPQGICFFVYVRGYVLWMFFQVYIRMYIYECMYNEHVFMSTYECIYNKYVFICNTQVRTLIIFPSVSTNICTINILHIHRQRMWRASMFACTSACIMYILSSTHVDTNILTIKVLWKKSQANEENVVSIRFSTNIHLRGSDENIITGILIYIYICIYKCKYTDNYVYTNHHHQLYFEYTCLHVHAYENTHIYLCIRACTCIYM